MNYRILKRTEKILVRSIQLQLYLTLISGPILVYWGLPVSIASPLGNILFHPLLTAFLFLSSLIFFCQILHIPHGIFVFALQKTSRSFHYLLAFGSQQWLVGFAKPPIWTLVALPIATALIFCCKKTRTPYRSIGCLLALSILFGAYLKYTSKQEPVTSIACNNGHVHILYTDKQTVLIDPGVLGARISSASWVEFTLVPTMIKMTGQTTIEHLVLLQPSQLTFDAIRALCNACRVKRIYMPLWQGPMTQGQKRSYAQYMDSVKTNNIEIIRIKPGLDINLGSEKLTFTPQEQRIKSKDIEYNAWLISGTIQGNTINYFSHKFKKDDQA